MANQPSYVRPGQPRSLCSPHVPMHHADTTHLYQSTRGMGTPSIDYPPRPVEIDLGNPRTLPSPSGPVVPTPWDQTYVTTYGEMSASTFSSPNLPRQFRADVPVRGTGQAPILQWYAANDGPWVPKGVIPEERNSKPKIASGPSAHYGHNYRHMHSSDLGALSYTGPNSDSGYGSYGQRHSEGNASIFSADLADRDHDSQSLLSHNTDYHSYPGTGLQSTNDMMQTRDIPRSEPWMLPSSADSPTLKCPGCHKTVKTKSELKKHELRHTRPFTCQVPGCSRTVGFSTTNDLDRHVRSKHPSDLENSKRFRCRAAGCKSKDKSWPRLDNFKSHLKRVHHLETDEQLDDLVRQAEYVDSIEDPEVTPDQSMPLSPSRMMEHDMPSLPSLQGPQTSLRSDYPNIFSVDTLDPKLSTPLEEPSNEPKIEKNDTLISIDIDEEERDNVLSSQEENTERRHTVSSSLSLEVPDAAIKESSATFQIGPDTSQPPKFEVARKEVSASDAKLTEVIKRILVGSKYAGETKDRNVHQSLDKGSVARVGSLSTLDPWNPKLTASPAIPHVHIKPDSPPSNADEADDTDLEAKAIEVLKTLRESGYIIQEPPKPQKALNAGSAASIKSENLVICQTCSKFKGRPCELKKHMKRHSRPYGCTFPKCSKTFGSKNDWKRHENSQHHHLESWRCAEEKAQGGTCAKVCYRRQLFQDHLKKEHHMAADETLKKLEGCRIGRNGQSRFWCGFCRSLVDLHRKGIDAWTERFDHIDDHFMGRNDCAKQDISSWVPVDSNESKELISDSSDSHDGPLSSHVPPTESLGPRGDVRHPTFSKDAGAPKRKHSSSSSDEHPKKKRTVPYTGETVVHCCQCDSPHNPKVDQSCATCPDGHKFCDNCKHEKLRVD